jgi:hypothetical protein
MLRKILGLTERQTGCMVVIVVRVDRARLRL